MRPEMELEHKCAAGGGGLALAADNVVRGYASLFGEVDQGGVAHFIGRGHPLEL